ncbi:MAG: PEP-CTERM sorting domain-containing protein, partial [Candidatus Omnitrophica bacterium]|nr:PEP-CTERM sorting domain-containing protein [Candidatus Omnitrophota bacterium]
PGEWLGVGFNLLSGKTFADVLADIADGDLRIGIHVQGFRNGGSESFVNNGVVPEPATVGLLAAGLLSLAAGRRRRIA